MSQLSFLPGSAHRGAVRQIFFAEYVWVPMDHLPVNLLYDPGHIKGPGLLTESDGKDDQEKEVSELCSQLARVSRVDGRGSFVGFFEKIGSQVHELLLSIPWTAGGASENRDELFELSEAVGHWVWCSAIGE